MAVAMSSIVQSKPVVKMEYILEYEIYEIQKYKNKNIQNYKMPKYEIQKMAWLR